MATPLAVIGRGLLSAAVGTLAMDGLWFWRYTQSNGEQSFWEWEFSVGLDNWDKASAPARVGKRLYEVLTGRELDARYAAVTNNVMHWGYGVSWGTLYGLLRPPVWASLPFGAFVWGTSYVVLPLMGLYKPIWEYDRHTLWQDLSAHLTYGAATGATFRVLTRAE